MIFAYVALLVGAFIIFNTFSITVAQRTREFGLLRTLGASRGQVMRSVILEGLFLGMLGGLLGLLGGILLAPGLDGLFKAVGADLPNNGTVLETRTIVVSLAVGIGITLIAGLVPAIRSTSISPLAAMREGSGESEVRKRGWKVAAAIGVLALLEFPPRSSTAGCRAQSSEPWSRSSPRAGSGSRAATSRATGSPVASRTSSGRRPRGAGSPAAWRWRTRSVSPAARSRQPRR